MRHLLRRLDFVFKKPKAIPGKADKVAQEEFLRLIEAKLAEIVSCGGREKRPFIMLHGTHPQHNTPPNILLIVHTVGSRGARTKRSRPTVQCGGWQATGQYQWSGKCT